MSDFMENFDDRFLMAVNQPDELVRSLPIETQVFIDPQEVVRRYREPASPELADDLGVKLTALWAKLNDGDIDLEVAHEYPLRAHTAMTDFLVTPNAIANFHTRGPSTEPFRFSRRLAVSSRSQSSIRMLEEGGSLMAVLERRKQTSFIKHPLFRKAHGSPILTLHQVGHLPAEAEDIQTALKLISYADPEKYPDNYKGINAIQIPARD